MPAPIPLPSGDLSAGTPFHSPTATIAYPTHQVVTTTESSRSHGDWGFKRPFPPKSTKKSSMIRIKHVDAVEHVTDFSSASDHGRTLQKYKELRLPVTIPLQSLPGSLSRSASFLRENSPKVSVFNESSDFTAIDTAKEKEAAGNRWKFRGPWLAGMTEGDFKKWVARSVRPRRTEFRAFLKKELAAELTAKASLKVQDEHGADATPVPVDPASITEQQLHEFMRTLRYQLHTLYKLVGDFLDLAPLTPPNALLESRKLHEAGGVEYNVPAIPGNPYSQEGPPTTHPSAGLSYLRTSAYLDNHPIYGPQARHPPVEARVIVPRMANWTRTGVLGVGGFITDTPQGDTESNDRYRKDNLVHLDLETEGGGKVFVEPLSASINANGRLIMAVKDADAEALLVAQELNGKVKVYGQQRHIPEKSLADFKIFDKPTSGGPVVGSSVSYGLAF